MTSLLDNEQVRHIDSLLEDGRLEDALSTMYTIVEQRHNSNALSIELRKTGSRLREFRREYEHGRVHFDQWTIERSKARDIVFGLWERVKSVSHTAFDEGSGWTALQEAERQYRHTLIKRFETFQPLGSDNEIRLESVYRDLAIYREYSSPYYKSREALMDELRLTEHSELLDLVRRDLGTSIASLLQQLQSTHNEFSMQPHATAGRDNVSEQLLKEPPLIADLSRLESPEQLSALLAARLSRDVVRSIAYDLNYKAGSLTTVLAEDRPVFATAGTLLDEKGALRRLLAKASATPESLLPKDMLGAVAHWRDRIFVEIAKYEKNKETVTLQDALDLWRNVVVLGHPGGGKTTLLHHTALTLARENAAILPVYVRLRDLNPPSAQDPPINLWTEVTRQLGFPTLDHRLFGEQGRRVLFLFDGLDEVDERWRSHVAHDIESTLSRIESASSVTTCRILGYSDYLKYKSLELSELTSEQIHAFVEDWFSHDGAIASTLLRRAHRSARMWRTLRNPFLLTMTCIAFAKAGGRDLRHCELYRVATRALLEVREKQKGLRRQEFATRDNDALLMRIAALLLEAGKELFTIESIITTTGLSGIKRQIDDIANVSGILRLLSDQDYGFAHLSLQEFYAAWQYHERGQSPIHLIASPRYWEMARQYCGMCSSDLANAFIRDAMDTAIAGESWRVVVFLCSCVAQVQDPAPDLVRALAQRIGTAFLGESVEGDDNTAIETALFERSREGESREMVAIALSELVEYDRSGATHDVLERLFRQDSSARFVAADVLATSSDSEKLAMLGRLLCELPYYQARDLITHLQKTTSPTLIDVYWHALRGEASLLALHSLMEVARALDIDVTDKMEYLLHADSSGGFDLEGFCLRLARDVPPGLFARTEEVFDIYIEHVSAYTQRERPVNRFTQREEAPDEFVMRLMEEQLHIPESRKDDFRMELMGYIGSFACNDTPVFLEETRLGPIVKQLLAHDHMTGFSGKLRRRWTPVVRSAAPTGIQWDGNTLFPGVLPFTIYEAITNCPFHLTLVKLMCSDAMFHKCGPPSDGWIRGLSTIMRRAARSRVTEDSYRMRMGIGWSKRMADYVERYREQNRHWSVQVEACQPSIASAVARWSSRWSEVDNALFSAMLSNNAIALTSNDPIWQVVV